MGRATEGPDPGVGKKLTFFLIEIELVWWISVVQQLMLLKLLPVFLERSRGQQRIEFHIRDYQRSQIEIRKIRSEMILWLICL
jgi:hypothetical protein